ncbi:MAG: hypothetical protein IPO56_15270 [Flavobacteriales bacterium]|nr:hypothetical protein [Flavobacteriales bacterium]
MKHLICLFLAFFGWSVLTDAQVDQLFERAKRKAEQRANRKIDQGIDKGLDKVEDSAKGGKKNKKKEKEEKEPEEGAEERTNMDGASASGMDPPKRMPPSRYGPRDTISNPVRRSSSMMIWKGKAAGRSPASGPIPRGCWRWRRSPARARA